MGDSFVLETEDIDSTTSFDPVPVPNYTMSFTLEEGSLVLISCAAHLWVYSTTTESPGIHGICYINWFCHDYYTSVGEKLWQGKIAAAEWGEAGSPLAIETGATQSFTRSIFLPAGTYVIGANFWISKARDYMGLEEITGSIGSRYINIITLKR